MLCRNFSFVLWNITLSSCVLRANSFYHNLVFDTNKKEEWPESKEKVIFVCFLWLFFSGFLSGF